MEKKKTLNLKDLGISDLFDLNTFTEALKENDINWNQDKAGFFTFDTLRASEQAQLFCQETF